MTNKKLPELENISAGQMIYLLTEHQKYQDQIAALNKKFKLWRKTSIQGVGIKQKIFDRVFEKYHAEDGGAESLQDLRIEKALCQKVDVDFGFQFSFFDEKPVEKPTLKSGAYQKGVMSFVARLKETENPFPSGQQQQDWLKGFRDAETMHKTGKEENEKQTKATPDAKAEKKPAAKKIAKKKATAKKATKKKA